MADVSPIAAQKWPHDSSSYEIESRAELDAHLAAGSLAGLTIQGLRLDVDPPDLTAVDLTYALFVGCHFRDADAAAEIVRRGANIVPVFDDVPFPTAPSRLYTPDDLAAGFFGRDGVERDGIGSAGETRDGLRSTSEKHDGIGNTGEERDGIGSAGEARDGRDRRSAAGFAAMYDTVVYQHFLEHGGPMPDVREALAQRIHDASIDDALADATQAWLAARGPASVVGIMGGHAIPRGTPPYRLAATLAQRLAHDERLVVTGGGPGIMEAANLGSYMGHWSADDLAAAIDRLALAPDFRDRDRYTALALALRRAYPRHSDAEADVVSQLAFGGLAIPTWLYGDEPANLFAGGIAKYFSNAIREDTILRLARGGLVFAPGLAGTVQEVFQAATKAFYLSDGASGPLVFLGRAFWTTTVPVTALLQPLLACSPHGDLSGLIHLTDDVAEAVSILGQASPT
jgi:predicted Rossmann-fold nucleotide-binding protein